MLTVQLVATLNPATMDALQLFRGDTILVRCVPFKLIPVLPAICCFV